MNHAAAAVKSLSVAVEFFRRDLEAVPADVFAQSFGGKSRAVADIVFEVNLVNDHVGMVVRGEKPFDWPEGGWMTAPEELREKSNAIHSFEKSSKRLVETFEAFDEAAMETPFQTDEGEKTRIERARFVASHLWYHCGQLNFIHTLLGDDQLHWG